MQIEQFRVKFMPCGYDAATGLSSARGNNIYADAANPHVWWHEKLPAEFPRRRSWCNRAREDRAGAFNLRRQAA